MSGFDSTAFLVDYLEPKVRSVIYNDMFIFDDEKNGGIFVDAPNKIGDSVRIPIEYNYTSNACTFLYGDPMPDSDDADGVIASFSKDSYQAAIRIYKLLEAYGSGIGDNVNDTMLATTVMRDPKNRAAINAMKAAINSTCVADMQTQVDSAGNFSDGALSRSTYGLASYEDTSGGSLSMTQLEDGISAMMTPTYGEASQEDLIIWAPMGQLKRIARFSGTAGVEISASNFPIVASAQDGSPVDVGRIGKTKSFDGVPIFYCPTMTTTNVLILRKGTWIREPWLPLTSEDKSAGVQAWQSLYLFVMGVFVYTDMPSWNGKISGLTA
jgi:hypothetical protein